MFRFVKAAISYLSGVADIWTIVQAIFPPITSTLMIWLAYIQGYPAVIIIFVGLVSAATALIIASEIRKWVRENSVYRYLGVRKFEPVDGEIQTQYRTLYVTISAVLENNSDRPLYYSVKRADLSLQGRINQGAKLDGGTSDVPPKSHRYFRFATIEGLSVNKRADGKVELEILYGPSPNNLKYKLHYEGTPSLIVRWDGVKNDGAIDSKMLCSIQRSDHSRVRML